jgi:glycosyltransferase involved in cell wall biosynthesis
MKIVQISKECSANGGVGTYVCNLLSSLQTAGHEVSIIHDDQSADCRLEQSHQFYVKHFDEYGRKTENEKSASQVMEILKSLNPDVVHVQGCNNFYLEAEIRRRFPAIKTLHVYDFCPSGNKFHHATQRACVHATGALCVPRMIYKRCLLTKRPNVIWKHYLRAKESNENNFQYRKLIVSSNHVKLQAVESGYSSEQIEVLPYYTTLPALNAKASSADKRILFIGRIVREKGLRKLLSVFKQLTTPAQLIIAGDGGDLPKIKSLSNQLGLGDKVSFFSWANSIQKDELYRNASVVVIPSVWPEPFGIVGIEAMSYAKPVVAFQTGGISEWLDDGKTGFLIAPYDVMQMSEKIDSLLKQKDLATEMGLFGRIKVQQNFSATQHLQQLLELYNNVIRAA